MLDFYFYNTNLVRFILFLKKSEKKYDFSKILNITEINVYFNIKNIIDLNNLSLSNYFYFFVASLALSIYLAFVLFGIFFVLFWDLLFLHFGIFSSL